MIGRGKDRNARSFGNGGGTGERPRQDGRGGARAGRPGEAAGPSRAAGDASAAARAAAETGRAGWTFLSNHAHVLACIAQDPEARVREIALRVGITERAVLRILGDLDDAGVITRTREGRRTRYAIDGQSPLRHPVESHRTVGELLALLAARD